MGESGGWGVGGLGGWGVGDYYKRKTHNESSTHAMCTHSLPVDMEQVSERKEREREREREKERERERGGGGGGGGGREAPPGRRGPACC